MRSNDKRERIINAALNSFSANGYHDTKMDEIAKKAEVGKGTIYGYFSNKEELFRKSLEFATDIFFREINKAAEGEKSVQEKIIDVLKIEYLTKDKYDNFAFTFMRESTNVEMDFKKFIYRMRSMKLNLYIRIISKAIENGTYRSDMDVNFAAALLMGSLNQIHFENFYHGRTEFSIEDTMKALEILENGFIKKQ